MGNRLEIQMYCFSLIQLDGISCIFPNNKILTILWNYADKSERELSTDSIKRINLCTFV